MENNKIAIIYDNNLLQECNRLPTMQCRASIVFDLINAYNLLSSDNVVVIKSVKATDDELKSFHSSDYIELIKNLNLKTEYDDYEQELEEFGLCYDCPILERCYEFVQTIAGSSISAAKLLVSKKFQTVINWFGGWHHAQRDSAEGFCYVNDIVLAIQILTKIFDKVLYLDLDIHHGNGVQNAFEYSNKILTLSFHKHLPGFFPGTGSLQDNGKGSGKYYTINIPFLDGVQDSSYLRVFEQIFPKVMEVFQPAAIVVQCGADSLNGDTVGESNLTLNGIGKCIESVIKYKLPTLFLGGGGYNFPNTARLWTYLTSIIIDRKIGDEIPDTSEFFPNYLPSYELFIDKGNQKDMNSIQYLDNLIETALNYCDFIC